MILPAIAACGLTTYIIQYYWKKQRISDYTELMEAYTLNEVLNPALNMTELEACELRTSGESAAHQVECISGINNNNIGKSHDRDQDNYNTAAPKIKMAAPKIKMASSSNTNTLSFEKELEFKLTERRCLVSSLQNNGNDCDLEGGGAAGSTSQGGGAAGSTSHMNSVCAKSNSHTNNYHNEQDHSDTTIFRKPRLSIEDANTLPQSLSKSPKSPPRSPTSTGAETNTARARFARVVSSPLPYVVLIMLVVMIIMIFVDVISISGVVCISALSMVLVVVVGNHWRGRLILVPSQMQDGFSKVSDEEKMTSLNDFFEELFASIDYSLLIIFLGI